MSRERCKRRRFCTVLLPAALLGGCMAHVMHGPQVEIGRSGAVALSAGAAACAGAAA